MLISDKYNCPISLSFALKIYQRDYLVPILCCIFVIANVVLGYILQSFEEIYWINSTLDKPNWGNFLNALWCMFVTMTNVGYGDLYPLSYGGRCACMIGGCFGIYFIAMIMIVVTQNKQISNNGMRAHQLIWRLKLKADMKEIQSRIVHKTLELCLLAAKHEDNSLPFKQYSRQKMNKKREIEELTGNIKEIQRQINTYSDKSIVIKLIELNYRIELDLKEMANEVISLESRDLNRFAL